MVIIVGKHGQLCNRIFHASAFLANAIEHDYCVYNARFNEYFQYFEDNHKRNKPSKNMRFIFQKNYFLHEICRRTLGLMVRLSIKFKIKNLFFIEIIEIFSWTSPSVFDLNNTDFVRKARSKVVLVAGWQFRDALNFDKYQDQIRAFWQPNSDIIWAAEKTIKQYRLPFDIIIGVHIRRGDYADFQNGKWFFNDDFYAQKLKEIMQLQSFKNKKIGFIICSNEVIKTDYFNTLNILIEQRPFVEDMLLLSLCDYIVGVPSTFSMWASFYGQKPLLQIMDSAQKMRFDDFKIINALN
jgi:Glycosyl transferase family 11